MTKDALVHETSLAIAISVLLGVQLVHKTGLLVSSGVVVSSGTDVSISTNAVVATCTSQTRCSCASANSTSAMVVRCVVEVTVLVVLGASVGGVGTVADVAETASSSATDVLWYTLELVVTLLTASENTTLGLELVHGHGWQSSGLVVGSSIVVNLMDGNSGVNNIGLDDLPVDDWLNGLVDVVVDVLTTNGGCYTLALCGALYSSLVPELRLLLNKIPLRGVMVAVIKLTVLYSTELGGVCLGKHLAVLDRLDSAVVMVLVNLLIDGSVDLLVLVRLHSLVGDSGSNSLVDCGVVVARLVGEVGKRCLNLVHFEVCV